MEAASLQETSVILEQEMKDDPDSPNLTEGEEGELDEKPAVKAKFQNSCQYCGKSLSSRRRVKEHIKHIHKGVPRVPNVKTSFPCELCDKVYSRKNFLRNHIMFCHENIRKYQCTTCEKFFASNRGLKKHVESLHGITTDYKCKFCSKILKSKWALKNHELIHTGVSPYGGVKAQKVLCPTCGKEYLKKELSFHIFDKHTLQNYSKDCAKQFDEESREKVVELVKKFGFLPVAEQLQLPVMLLRHWKQPKTEAVCSICGITVLKRALSTHMRIHAEGKVRTGRTEKPMKDIRSSSRLLRDAPIRRVAGPATATDNLGDHKMKEIADYAVATRSVRIKIFSQSKHFHDQNIFTNKTFS